MQAGLRQEGARQEGLLARSGRALDVESRLRWLQRQHQVPPAHPPMIPCSPAARHQQPQHVQQHHQHGQAAVAGYRPHLLRHPRVSPASACDLFLASCMQAALWPPLAILPTFALLVTAQPLMRDPQVPALLPWCRYTVYSTEYHTVRGCVGMNGERFAVGGRRRVVRQLAAMMQANSEARGGMMLALSHLNRYFCCLSPRPTSAWLAMERWMSWGPMMATRCREDASRTPAVSCRCASCCRVQLHVLLLGGAAASAAALRCHPGGLL